jgi:predicted nucleic acid-binding protein
MDKAIDKTVSRRAVVDSNAIDPIADNSGAYEAVRSAIDAGKLELLYTHVNIDELTAIPDGDRRAWLVLILVDIGRLVPTGTMALSFSRLNFCRVGNESDSDFWEALRSGNVVHTRDALIASTARFEGASLVTNEKRLAARARDWNIEVLSTHELLAELGFKY